MTVTSYPEIGPPSGFDIQILCEVMGTESYAQPIWTDPRGSEILTRGQGKVLG